MKEHNFFFNPKDDQIPIILILVILFITVPIFLWAVWQDVKFLF